VTVVEFVSAVDELAPALAAIYRASFAESPYEEGEEDVERFARSQLPTHTRRRDFRCAIAREGGELVGFAYGYTGEAGQFWTEWVRERIPADLAEEWLGGHFEFVELAVLPDHQRRGIGSALHDALLADLPHQRALLSTLREDTAARRLYLRRGWRVLWEDLNGKSSLLGLELPRSARA
jgi:ribosomal protein S18 acetylase RimI-like enzyme